MSKETSAPAGQYGERIARGAAFLDEHVPGWRQRLDLGRLDVSHPSFCVLSQLDAWRHFDADESTEPYGFFLAGDADVGYPQLTQEWLAYIEATR